MERCESAYFAAVEPSWLGRRRLTGVQRAGKKFESRALERLSGLFGDWLLPSPWITFYNGEKWRWIQPDALVIRPDLGWIGLIEIKLTHTIGAWTQMWERYVPVLRCLFPPAIWMFKCTEICKKVNGRPRMYGPSKVVAKPLEHHWGVTGICLWPC